MIREANIEDINDIVSISNRYSENLTNYNNIKGDFIKNPFSQFIVYILNNKIIGYANYFTIFERMEIINIAVIEEYRKQGIASKMMEYIIGRATQNNCENITLEVRKGNSKAIGLYQKYGFKEVATRKNYYGNEDGILMEKKLVVK